MTWSDFYLICFAVGFLLSAVSFLARRTALALASAALSGCGRPRGVGHAPTGHATGAAHSAAAGGHAGDESPVSPFNFVTLTAFLAWFGGTGFLITRFSSIWFALGLLIALGAGLFGAGIVFLFLTRVLISREENMDCRRLRNGRRAGTNLDAHP